MMKNDHVLQALKFMESAIGKTSGNIAYNRKLLKIQVKSLKNTRYSVNFCKIARKPEIILICEPFLQRLNLHNNKEV